jgi:hypothetical protein
LAGDGELEIRQDVTAMPRDGSLRSGPLSKSSSRRPPQHGDRGATDIAVKHKFSRSLRPLEILDAMLPGVVPDFVPFLVED